MAHDGALSRHRSRLLAETARAQSEASDPSVSAWVAANAGTGKTHVLKMRVLRLLLAGTAPERILCLTYTKAAAAEMADRVFGDLGRWATCGAASLDTGLGELLGRAPTSAERLLARRLFARAIETPGGLKVQTIHAFCERLLQRFPLEAGVPPGFDILDEPTGAALRREAIEGVLAAATRDMAAPLGCALRTVIAFVGADAFDVTLGAALAERAWLAAMSRLELRAPGTTDEIAAFYRRALGLAPDATLAAVDRAMASIVETAGIGPAAALLATGTARDLKAAARARTVLSAPSPAALVNALAAFFLTAEGGPRKDLMTAKLESARPDVDAALAAGQAKFLSLHRERKALVLADATAALVRLADAVMQAYGEAKTRRAALDFEDLIAHTAALLASSAAAEWVLYKLDGGIDHILVDEAQDTSPAQWSIVQALAAEFFVGAGARRDARTLFAVGDEKQSIYSFQGAAPKMFAETGQRVRRLAAQAGLPLRLVPLTLSFRTVEPVLAAIDRVFADGRIASGLTAAGEGVRHLASRQGQAGLVEIWPTECWSQIEPTPAWDPLAEKSTASPVLKLADRIAATIAGWLDRGEMLESENRAIRPGDVLILVRARRAFAAAMVAALKARAIPVAGSDRIVLHEQIAVQDLMALADFLLLPEDDLALAVVLKSPLIGLGDDDLMRIAPARNGMLWAALLDRAKVDPALRPAVEALKRWRQQADFVPPYEFFASLLDRDGGRARLLARLGPDASDPIDEFLALALTYDKGAAPSLQGFIAWARQGAREIKRDMEHGRNEVRVMTVHGAKGLEAPIVFLPDTCSAPTLRQSGRLVALAAATPAGMTAPLAWPVKGTGAVEALREGQRAARAAEIEEHNRLLYVAMTRARDRLYVAGYESKNGRDKGCWYDVVSQSLAGAGCHVTWPDGRRALRIEAGQTAPYEAPKAPAPQPTAAHPLPAWASRRAPSEPQLTMPLAPSRLAPYDIDEMGEPAEPPRRRGGWVDLRAASPLVLADSHRFLRGSLTHALLEHLPPVPDDRRETAAKAFLAQRGKELSAGAQASIVAEALAVLRDPAFGAVFGPKSRAEVAIVAEIVRPKGRGPALRLAGQIDRLAVLDDAIVIMDYKTNRPRPRTAAEVATAYLYQLAAYRLAVRRIFAGAHAKRVTAAILWTDGARLMPIPDDLLDRHEQGLWTLDAAALTAEGPLPT